MFRVLLAASFLAATIPPAQFADPGQGSSWTGTQFLAFSPDSRRLAICGPEDTQIRVWDLPANKALPALIGHRGWVGAVEFSTDGRTLVSGSQDTSCIAWDMTRQPYATSRWIAIRIPPRCSRQVRMPVRC